VSRLSSRRPPVCCSAASPATRTLEELRTDVVASSKEAVEKIKASEDLRDLEGLRVEFLGKKGRITTVMKSVGKLPKEDRPKLGSVVNVAKEEVAAAVAERKAHLEELKDQEIDKDTIIDVTLPGIRPRKMVGRIHPLNSTMDRAIEIFEELGYDLIDDPEYNREIETDYYCFDALNCPPDHPARTMQDTLYLTEDKSMMLRTQTSAVQIRYMEKNEPPYAIIAPGKVYRRDSMEVDVFFRGKWLEVLGCGMVDPRVLRKVGIDPETHQGFAAGFGVERFAMVIHEIDDIREFYKNDLRFLEQFMHDS